jgi:flavin-dependent dehydrogenase
VLDTDVAIIGAGPAGATTALNLAPFRRVLLIDRRSDPTDRIGESLPAAARRLLLDMGLFADFTADGHAPTYASRSIWGSPDPVERDCLRDLDGHGWRLDRRQFEARLRSTAVARGAVLLAPARVLDFTRGVDGFALHLDVCGEARTVTARMVVDAAGRTSQFGSRLGAMRTRHDRLICGWVHGVTSEPSADDGLVYTEAEEDGWWYTAALPDGRRALAFHTDSDLESGASVRSAGALLRRAARLPGLSKVIAGARFDPDLQVGVTAAHGSTLAPTVGADWLATGDAALSFDPLSSQGLFHALYTGLAVAEAIDGLLAGRCESGREYVASLANIEATYRQRLAAYYGLERRWPGSTFWRRRHALGATYPSRVELGD